MKNYFNAPLKILLIKLYHVLKYCTTKIRPLSITDFRLVPQVGLEPTKHPQARRNRKRGRNPDGKAITVARCGFRAQRRSSEAGGYWPDRPMKQSRACDDVAAVVLGALRPQAARRLVGSKCNVKGQQKRHPKGSCG